MKAATNLLRVCPQTYDDGLPDTTFSGWPYELDHFQKYAVEATLRGHHVLVTASTGSGKTLAGEHAIQYFCRDKALKVIYTAPIKSLSNQKFHEFTGRFPDISFGLLTGDIKFNPEADCVIMTTEILRNALCGEQRTMTEFQLDMTQVGCVIFDEVHYINDRDRGMVWEESIIRMPHTIQLVMLSATIDRSEQFAQWVAETTQRDVWLCSTDVRVVPLNHYSYFVLPQSTLKQFVGSPIETLIKDANGAFTSLSQASINNLHKIAREMEKRQIAPPRRKFVFNQIARKLKEEGMLPAICFVFSRKRVVEHASEIEINLFEDIGEEKKPALVSKECEHILRQKLPNYAEYLMLPEYTEVVKLLQKGIAIHHSGMLPVLKEMIEMLFSKGYIKLLFATETFAVGVNMPTKTVVFSSLEKYDGNGFRMLHSHEYTQMAGRAGRRGMDTVGHVIHLNNLFDTPYTQDYQRMLNGTPQTLISKFDITFDLVLRSGVDDTAAIHTIAAKSMMNTLEIGNELQAVQQDIERLEEDACQSNKVVITPELEQYKALLSELEFSKNKRRKKLLEDIKQLEDTHPALAQQYAALQTAGDKERELQAKRDELVQVTNYVETTEAAVKCVLTTEGFIHPDDGSLTLKGKLAARIREVAPLPFAEIMADRLLTSLSTPHLAAVLSCFTSIRVGDDIRCHTPTVERELTTRLYSIYDHYYYVELDCRKTVDEDAYTVHYDLQSAMVEWCEASSEMAAKDVIQKLSASGIFLGEFVKAILKISAIASELQQACEILDPPNLELKQRLAQIPELTLKYVATNQSLYV